MICFQGQRFRWLFVLGIFTYTICTVILLQLFGQYSVKYTDGASRSNSALMNYENPRETRQQRIPVSLQPEHFDFIVNESRRYLFDRLKTLSMTHIRTCNIKEKQTSVLYNEGNSTVGFTNTGSYKLLYPKWQHEFDTNKTYFLAAVLRVRIYEEDKAKWTVAELKQWLHYQFWAGADHVYICNHYLKESENIAGSLKTYIQKGLVTVFPWNSIKSIPGTEHYSETNPENQNGCYNHVLTRFGNKTVWFYSLDMDEYAYSTVDFCEGFFSRYLKSIQIETDRGVAAIYLDNFILKGQGDRSRDITIDRINRITPNKANNLVKPVYMAKFTKVNAMHGVELRSGKKVLKMDSKIFKMLHYWGARTQNWGPDNNDTLGSTVEFDDVRDTLAMQSDIHYWHLETLKHLAIAPALKRQFCRMQN